MLERGKIHGFESQKDDNGDAVFARVIPSLTPDLVTKPLSIPWYWRGAFGNLKVGDEVFFERTADLGGLIHGRTDGNWDFTIRNAADKKLKLQNHCEVGGNSEVKGNSKVTGSVDVSDKLTVTKEIKSTSGDVKAGSISLKTHTHNYTPPLHPQPSQAPTGKPNAG